MGACGRTWGGVAAALWVAATWGGAGCGDGAAAGVDAASERDAQPDVGAEGDAGDAGGPVDGADVERDADGAVGDGVGEDGGGVGDAVDAASDGDGSNPDGDAAGDVADDGDLGSASDGDLGSASDGDLGSASDGDLGSASDGDGDDAGPSPSLPFPVEGFGAGSLGGWQEGHTVVWVTSLADSGPGTLREALQSGGAPRVVRFAVDGAIPLETPLLLPSNLTLDGRGRDVTLRGKGLVLGGSDHVVLVNFALEDIGPDSEDGVQIGHPDDPAEHIVLDHLRFEQHGDGGDSKRVDEAISVVFGARHITIAWCRFVNWEKVMLFGNGDAAPALDAQMRVTVHHNWAHATGRRHPQARRVGVGGCRIVRQAGEGAAQGQRARAGIGEVELHAGVDVVVGDRESHRRCQGQRGQQCTG